jgi:Tfp pilus assembly protein FimT
MEVLIVLGVLGILLALSAPALTGYIQRLRFQEGVRAFSENLLRARDTATSRSLTVRVSASGSQLTWYDEEGNSVLGSTTLPNNTRLAAEHDSVLISGRGLPLGQTAFSLTDGTRTASVWLLPTGAILR